ncbi:MAG: Lrp/AsnC family transcriptional regulator [Clostridia bacterium]|nr:Lrp/AsnC family transcriptional regulator [Clostridia bacterium]
MNELKWKLLELLHQDAFLDAKQLAVMLDKAEEEISQSIAELENDGIIMGYGAVINTEAVNDDKVSALIEVKITPQRDRGFDAIARMIYSFPEVKSCYLMSGAYDLMLIVEGENIRQVGSFVSDKLSVLDNVLSCATHFILKRYKQDGNVFTAQDEDKRQAVSP